MSKPPSQANPNKICEIIGLARFYSSEPGLINGLQRLQIRIFSPFALALSAPREACFLDYSD